VDLTRAAECSNLVPPHRAATAPSDVLAFTNMPRTVTVSAARLPPAEHAALVLTLCSAAQDFASMARRIADQEKNRKWWQV